MLSVMRSEGGGASTVERIVEEREVDGHPVAVVEDMTDEGSGFVVVVNEVVLNDGEPLGHIPSDEEVRGLMHRKRPR